MSFDTPVATLQLKAGELTCGMRAPTTRPVKRRAMQSSRTSTRGVSAVGYWDITNSDSDSAVRRSDVALAHRVDRTHAVATCEYRNYVLAKLLRAVFLAHSVDVAGDRRRHLPVRHTAAEHRARRFHGLLASLVRGFLRDRARRERERGDGDDMLHIVSVSSGHSPRLCPRLPTRGRRYSPVGQSLCCRSRPAITARAYLTSFSGPRGVTCTEDSAGLVGFRDGLAALLTPPSRALRAVPRGRGA